MGDNRSGTRKLSKEDRPKCGEQFGNILSYGVETIADPLVNIAISPATRGIASFVRANTKATYINFDRFKQISEMCAPNAIAVNKTDDEKTHSAISLDMGKCILCGRCRDAAPDLFQLESKFALPSKERSGLIEQYNFEITSPESGNDASHELIGGELKDKINKMLGRSLAVREVDAGSCNGCEVEINALSNAIYDIERFGVHFVSSPRHADVLLVTGPVSRNMELALKRTYDATPDPKMVVAVGACGCSGGIFGDTYGTVGGVGSVVPVDIYVPGCPPRPAVILYGLLLAVGKIGEYGGTNKH
ncbi:MAG: NADH-quinone oxidoreductase subunit NuoB [Thaumarchaeota archaeon]|nr:NADH-quinone oxidoreductase subunit NuoB [Nitrososphaerota archaeon]